eukprot:TRINITY_DN1702_c0_g2_i2.p1 TRINITY_DN1702_c0_g2~~TRINITY_DN1702_c0_g2_i2.p1  ORF type:complete len:437 (-),score=58.55 TRINITY_DN1702_c0_g2_i2:45-1355(-)
MGQKVSRPVPIKNQSTDTITLKIPLEPIRDTDVDVAFLVSIWALPKEIWKLIFSYLDLQQIFRSGQTCRKFYHITSDRRKLAQGPPMYAYTTPTQERQDLRLFCDGWSLAWNDQGNPILIKEGCDPVIVSPNGRRATFPVCLDQQWKLCWHISDQLTFDLAYVDGDTIRKQHFELQVKGNLKIQRLIPVQGCLVIVNQDEDPYFVDPKLKTMVKIKNTDLSYIIELEWTQAFGKTYVFARRRWWILHCDDNGIQCQESSYPGKLFFGIAPVATPLEDGRIVLLDPSVESFDSICILTTKSDEFNMQQCSGFYPTNSAGFTVVSSGNLIAFFVGKVSITLRVFYILQVDLAHWTSHVCTPHFKCSINGIRMNGDYISLLGESSLSHPAIRIHIYLGEGHQKKELENEPSPVEIAPRRISDHPMVIFRFHKLVQQSIE